MLPQLGLAQGRPTAERAKEEADKQTESEKELKQATQGRRGRWAALGGARPHDDHAVARRDLLDDACSGSAV